MHQSPIIQQLSHTINKITLINIRESKFKQTFHLIIMPHWAELKSQ